MTDMSDRSKIVEYIAKICSIFLDFGTNRFKRTKMTVKCH